LVSAILQNGTKYSTKILLGGVIHTQIHAELKRVKLNFCVLLEKFFIKCLYKDMK